MGVFSERDGSANKMRESGEALSHIMEETRNIIVPGISTDKLDKKIEELIIKNGCVPVLKGYEGFPGSACISVNDQVAHGLPASDHFLDEGDIVKVDISISKDGYFSDMARTFPVGEVVPELHSLIKGAAEVFYAGLEVARPGTPVNIIGKALDEKAGSLGYSTVRDLYGHGIGKVLHELPEIPAFYDEEHNHILREGETIAIEPMINMGGADVIWEDGDDFTVYTEDYSFSAHFENTVLITENGPECLTFLEEEVP